jgi:hypothetical protein
MKVICYWTLLILGLFCCVSIAAPKPAIIQDPGLYTVEVKFEHPQQLLVQGHGGLQVLWYMILTVTNRSGSDVDFYPRCELMTDTFEIVPAGRDLPSRVFWQIKRRHKQKYPFLESLEQSGNQVLQGEDNAKDIVIIWRDFDKEAKSIDLFIGGLSNETAVVEYPRTKASGFNEAQKVYLRKSLQLSYSLRGDPGLRGDVKLAYKGKAWVMR